MKSIVILLAVLGLVLCEDEPPPGETLLKGSRDRPSQPEGQSRTLARGSSGSCSANTKVGGCGYRCTAANQKKCQWTYCWYKITTGYYCGLLFEFVFPIWYKGPVCKKPGDKCSKSGNPWGGNPWDAPPFVLHPWGPKPVKPCYCCTTHKWIKKVGIIYHNGWYFSISFWVKVPAGCYCYKK